MRVAASRLAMTSLLCVSSRALRSAAPPLALLRSPPGAAPVPLYRAIRSDVGGRGRRGWWAGCHHGVRGDNCNGRRCVAALSTTSGDGAELELDLDLDLDRPGEGEDAAEDALVGWAGAGGDKGRVVEPGSIYFVATPIGRCRAHTRRH